MLETARKPRVGIMTLATGRFQEMGSDTQEGSYHQRQLDIRKVFLQRLENGAELVDSGILYTRSDVRAAMDRCYNAHVDMVFVCFLSWSEDFAFVRLLRDCYPVPMFVAHIARESLGFSDSLSDSRFVDFLAAGGLVGSLQGSGSVARYARPMLTVAVGLPDDIARRALAFASAAKVRALLRESHFGLLPAYNEVMWSTYVDPNALFQNVGPELHFLSVGALEREAAAISDAEAMKTVEVLRSRYPVAEDVDERKFMHSVRASLALEALMRRYDLDMLSLNDVDPMLLETIGLRPGFTPTPGAPIGTITPEGDVGGALASYILRALTGQHVSFVEPFHIDREKGCFAAGHAGPGDYTDPAGQTIIARDVRFAKTAYKHAGAPFAWYVIPPGPKTFLHISQRGDGSFTCVCAKTEALPCKPFLAGYSHGLFTVSGSLTRFFERLMRIGVTQHYAVVAGDHRETLAHIAMLLNMAYSEVDGE